LLEWFWVSGVVGMGVVRVGLFERLGLWGLLFWGRWFKPTPRINSSRGAHHRLKLTKSAEWSLSPIFQWGVKRCMKYDQVSSRAIMMHPATNTSIIKITNTINEMNHQPAV
jgi:hypothetical protein